MDADCPGIQPDTAARLVTLRERLRGFRAELQEGNVSPELWSGVVECGVEATSLRESAMNQLNREPDSEHTRRGAGYAISIETDIWSFANAIAGLCLKQAEARRDTDT
ncbi:hypothetical protein [Stackebrandtia nassauensis]|uniref:Uncharacterized protein n=1 Tax=Stackebrandtia nassauensis (strain DSM 44728 / CIP 108903 / NRRL B-16338 / NBRC 102104 / LLR-40K-21) TaxID=446470 RepID=D3PYG4_STANL|nr:hypothetical protein [Stackebrandtia nassauensis]ADD41531.1 hypothetical protein Snas_1835 [Stackebrandtia nassauensis DSM 44728]